MTRLQTCLDRLESLYGPPGPHLTTPFELVMWENAGYLIDDRRRAAVLEQLRQRVGLSPAAILEAPLDVLRDIASMGGMRPAPRIEKWLTTASLAMTPLPSQPAAMKRALRKFPGIGEPGAQKIMLFCGWDPVLALESNGLRVLQRLGYGQDHDQYAVAYRLAQSKAAPELAADGPTLIRAWHLLRRHGQELCKRQSPNCTPCPLADVCSYYQDRRITQPVGQK